MQQCLADSEEERRAVKTVECLEEKRNRFFRGEDEAIMYSPVRLQRLSPPVSITSY